MANLLNTLTNNKWKVFGVVALVIAVALWTTNSDAAELDQAPLGVTQERLLGQWEVEPFYTYENSKFNGDATARHNFGALVGVLDNRLTVGASTYYADVSNNRLGDVFVFGTANVGNLFGVSVVPSVGLLIPNGFENGDPFGQQVSAGSYSLQPALALVGDVGPLQVGAQYVGVFRLDDNPRGRQLGDVNTIKAWASATVFDNVTVYATGEAEFVGDTSNGNFQFADDSESVLLGAGARARVYGFEVAGEVLFPVYEEFSRASFNEQRVFRLGVQRAF